MRTVSPQLVGKEWLVESEAAYHFGALAEFLFLAICLTEGVRSMSRRRDHSATSPPEDLKILSQSK